MQMHQRLPLHRLQLSLQDLGLKLWLGHDVNLDLPITAEVKTKSSEVLKIVNTDRKYVI